jgi:hypothetical protein
MAMDLTRLAIEFRVDEANGNVHLSNPRGEHDVDALDCWCTPTFYRVCDCAHGCWKCSDGKDRITLADAEFCEDPVIIVHSIGLRVVQE